MIGNQPTTTHWRKTYSVQAVRLTENNMQQIADFLGADLGEDPEVEVGPGLCIRYALEIGWVGDWLLQRGDRFEFIGHEDFMSDYHTHNEQMANDEKYARVYALVCEAMMKQDKATFHGETNGMDLVAIEISKKLVREL